MSIIDSQEFNFVVQKLRTFFLQKGFIEVHTQNRLSILAACEDPSTIASYDYAGKVWPLPQTGQMWLEYEMLKYPDRAPGYFCVSTSYRNEANPVPGRHEIIFPMFEFEIKGGMDELIKMEKELLEYLGFCSKDKCIEVDYREVARKYNTEELENEHEEQLCEDHGPVVLLKDFPMNTSPFWNMKLHDDDKTKAKKVDVILWGIETIGSAERSTDVNEMRKQFYSISDEGYSKILFDKFTKDRVEGELDEFLNFNFFERSGGGIGMTRMIRAMKLSGLLNYEENKQNNQQQTCLY
jgi:aspartyl/asparaginyl-tRNA synthetase